VCSSKDVFRNRVAEQPGFNQQATKNKSHHTSF